jgi:hypothetical protein
MDAPMARAQDALERPTYSLRTEAAGIIGLGGMRFIPMQNLTDIAIFVKVVELSGFTAAAEALDMSQPVVSKAVTRLEEKLGARLLNRTTRRLSLTEAGSELYGRSVRALAEIENAELEVARFQTEPRGLLRVSAPMSFSILQLGPAIQSFLTRFPGVTPAAMATAARMAPPPGMSPAGVGKVASSLVARSRAPRRTAVDATRSRS